MAPDINPQDVQQNPKYPNDEQVWQWGNEFANQWLRGQQSTLTREQYVARKACDWQSHQCREQVARWMLSRGFATGHDTIEDLLAELVGEVREQDALICESKKDRFGGVDYHEACDECATAIRNGVRP